MLCNKKTDDLINLRQGSVSHLVRSSIWDVKRKIDKTDKTWYSNRPSYLICLKWTISQDKKQTLARLKPYTYINDY